MKKRMPTLGKDLNGGSNLNFPSIKPGALLMWIGGGGVVTIITIIISLTYAFGKKTEGFYRDISQNKEAITEVVSEVSALKIGLNELKDLQVKDLRIVTAAISAIDGNIGVMSNDLGWIKKELIKISTKSGSTP